MHYNHSTMYLSRYIAIERFRDYGSYPALKVHLHEIFDLKFIFIKRSRLVPDSDSKLFQDKFEFVEIFKFESSSMYVRA
jgi:hypothetical protein